MEDQPSVKASDAPAPAQSTHEEHQTQRAELPPLFTLLHDAWKAFTERWSLYVSIMAAVAVVQIIFNFLTPRNENEIEFYFTSNDASLFIPMLVVLAIMIVVGILIQSTLIYAVTHRNDSDLSLATAFRGGLHWAGKYVLVSLLVGLSVVVGFVLLIIPGIIVAVWVAFAPYVLFKENTTVVGAVKRSRELTRGYWWPIFGRIVGFFVMVMIVSGLVGVIQYLGPLVSTLLITPISTLFVALLYEALAAGVKTSRNA